MASETYPTPAEGWTCFHCGMHFGPTFQGWQEAFHHFGEDVQGDAYCQMTARQVRGMQDMLKQYQQEDTALHRHIARLESDHATALRREEEKGYARGVADRTAEFKNFHRLLCERFGYGHDPVDWQRDQLSLIEHIARLTFGFSRMSTGSALSNATQDRGGEPA